MSKSRTELLSSMTQIPPSVSVDRQAFRDKYLNVTSNEQVCTDATLVPGTGKIATEKQ